MPYEIAQGLEETCVELDELKMAAGTNEEMLNSYIAKFMYDKDTLAVTGINLKKGHRFKKPNNIENQIVETVGHEIFPHITSRCQKSTHRKIEASKRFPEQDSAIYSDPSKSTKSVQSILKSSNGSKVKMDKFRSLTYMGSL